MKIDNFAALLRKHKVVIPPIQRDYAQGRGSDKVKRIRDRFLGAMAGVLSDEGTGKLLQLDFIYGYVTKDEVENNEPITMFKPLDGQQRLTTLFLVHWYVAATEGKLDEAIDFLARFSYATRAKSREFCRRLIEFRPELGGDSVNKQIENQPWFFLSWGSDPTVSSMLVVLEAIEKEFSQKGVKGAWDKLTGEEPRIIFHLLEMKDLGLPDDLYIKMNSRGKELTDFEHFKSQFSRVMRGLNRKQFDENIDQKWSDLFWSIFKEHSSSDLARLVDSGFLGFFWYITDLLVARDRIVIEEDYWVPVVQTVYADEQNVEFLFMSLNLFSRQEKTDVQYFDRLFYTDPEGYELGKTRLFFNNAKVNLFRKCAEAYDRSSQRNPFSMGEQLMLYACILHQHHEADNFSVNIRKIRNLIASSEDHVRKENLGSLYHEIERIVLNKMDSDKTEFSKSQHDEEKLKQALRNDNPAIEDVLFKLEDHRLLRGTLSIFGLEDAIESHAEKFQQIFQSDCDYYQISQAMLTVGDYTQYYGRLKRFGNKADSIWRELFTPSIHRKNFETTSRILRDYLQLFVGDSQTSNERLIESYIEKGVKSWRYYYVKYDRFQKWEDHATSGFYSWDDYSNKPFVCHMMFKRQFNGRHWDPYLIEIKNQNSHCSLENYGNSIQFTCGDTILMISMNNSAFVFSSQPDDEASFAVLKRLSKAGLLNGASELEVGQFSDKEDVADRIETCVSTLGEIEKFLN